MSKVVSMLTKNNSSNFLKNIQYNILTVAFLRFPRLRAVLQGNIVLRPIFNIINNSFSFFYGTYGDLENMAIYVDDGPNKLL